MTKVQEVQSFATSDGKLFKSVTPAERHQRELDYVTKMRSLIGPHPNSNGYIQFTKETKKAFDNLYEEAVKLCFSDDGYATFMRGGPKGFIGRILCDGDSPLYSFWCAAISIDDENRYWQQAYFANNPGSAPLACLGER